MQQPNRLLGHRKRRDRMAFCDELIAGTNASIIIVDKHHQPGGHWNDAYPFVRLHQPSAFYGVNSKKLGNNTIDATGLNKGLYELATILRYAAISIRSCKDSSCHRVEFATSLAANT